MDFTQVSVHFIKKSLKYMYIFYKSTEIFLSIVVQKMDTLSNLELVTEC